MFPSESVCVFVCGKLRKGINDIVCGCVPVCIASFECSITTIKNNSKSYDDDPIMILLYFLMSSLDVIYELLV